MEASRQWAHQFTVQPEHVEYLMNVLLEREKPLSSADLARALIQRQLDENYAALQAQYKDVLLYNPSQTYEVGQRLIFPTLGYGTATVTAIRPGFNPEYGDFNVIAVEFDDSADPREFAADLKPSHKLNDEVADFMLAAPGEELTTEQVLAEIGEDFIPELESALLEEDNLLFVTRRWFPQDLLLEVNEGHLNLAEAVLDMVNGGPLTTQGILEQIGGLGDADAELQSFSLNYALNQDPRFDEVGPAGEVLWYLASLEPAEVRQMPPVLRYTPGETDRAHLTPDMIALEREIGDEHSPLPDPGKVDQATVTLIYPHRRAGTLPLNPVTRRVFPTARRAPRIYVTLVDGQDGEEFTGWVVHQEHYVYGLLPFYTKHKLPIGGYVTVRRGEGPGRIIVDYHAYRPRTEYVRLIGVENNQLQIDSTKRAIGADYDDLMIIGIDELAPVEAYAQLLQNQRRALPALLRLIVPPLARLNPQGTVHARTLYSALNVFRRCPPGPMLAMLNANPDFENVGGHYWRLAEEPS